jgi:NhaP-type Na+/H+ or K+/H+ antiporter
LGLGVTFFLFSLKGEIMVSTLPQMLYDIIDLLASLLRMLGLAVFGLGIGWLAVDLLRKVSAWQFQAIIFLGLLGVAIALVVFSSWGAMGAFFIGLGVAIILWGMPKKKKEEKEK